ncbi:hypothetical protein DMENIID0001_084430 [Sergentomyia squamirostris]
MEDFETNILGDYFPSEPDGNTGFDYQLEILLHFCLMFRHLRCQEFAIGYEVQEIKKFEDIVCEFTWNQKKYFVGVQAKHVHNEDRALNDNHLSVGPSGKPSKSNSKQKNFYIEQYLRAIDGMKDQKFVEGEHLFVLFTNAKVANVNQEESSSSRAESKILQRTELNDPFCQLFSSVSEQSDVLKSKLHEQYQNLIYLTNCPNTEKLKEINNEILKENFETKNNSSFSMLLRRNIVSQMAYNNLRKTRKTLVRVDFENILMNSILESDLQNISESHLRELPFEVEFREEVLEEVFRKLTAKTILFECPTGVAINAVKVYKSLHKHDKDALIIPFSKLSEIQKEALKFWTKKIIILMDQEDSVEGFWQNENLIFVRQSKSEILTFSLNELTKNSENVFLNQKIKVQNSETPLNQITKTTDSVEWNNLMEEMFLKLFSKNLVEIGSNLSERKIPEIYLNRPFQYIEKEEEFQEGYYRHSETETITQEELLTKYQYSVIRGGPGMGKSTTLQKIAVDYKKVYPQIWIEFFELNLLGEVFFEKEKSNSLNFDKNEAIEFLLKKLIMKKGVVDDLSRKYVEYCLSLKNPSVVLIFDGFDEIMPTYEKIVFNLIKQLSASNVRICVSGRLQTEEILKELNFKEFQIEKYSNEERDQYLTMFFESKLNNLKNQPDFKSQHSSQELKEFIFENFSDINWDMSSSNFDIWNVPLFLNMMATVIFNEFRKQDFNLESLKLNSDFFSELSIYEKTFQQSFDIFHSKDETCPTNNLKRVMRDAEVENVKRIHVTLAGKELNLKVRSPLEIRKNEYIVTLARGFVVQINEDEFRFTHRTFAEFFYALDFGNLFRNGDSEILKQFVEMIGTNELVQMKFSRRSDHPKKNYPPMHRFIYQMIIRDMENNWKIPEVRNSETAQILLKIFEALISYCVESYLGKLPLVMNFLRKNFHGFRKHFTLQYLYTKQPRMKPYFNLKTFKSFLEEHKKYGDVKSVMHFLTQYRDDVCRKQFLDPEDGLILEIIHNQIKEFDDPNVDHFKDIFGNSGDYFSDFSEDLASFPENWHFFDNCIDILEERAEYRKYLKKFIQMCCSEFSKDIRIIDFIPMLNDDSFSYVNVKKVGIDTLCEIAYSFFLPADGYSLMYHFWSRRCYAEVCLLVQSVSKELVDKMTQSPYFGGQSFLEFYHSEQNKDFFEYSYLKYCYENYGEEYVFKFLSSYSRDKNISLIIKKDFKICYYLYCFRENLIDSSLFEKVSEKFVDNVLKYEAESGFKTGLLHIFIKLGLEEHLFSHYEDAEGPKGVDIVYCDQAGTKKLVLVLSYMIQLLRSKSDSSSNFENVLIEKLREQDEEGNYPLLIKAQAYTVDKFFIQELIRICEEAGYDFVMPDGNSILFHYWIQKRVFLFSIFLEVLSKEKVKELTDSPRFDRMSLMEYYESPQNDGFVMQSYLLYNYQQVGEEKFIWNFTCAYNWDENQDRSFRRQLSFCHILRDTFRGNRVLEKYATEFGNNVVQLECDSGQQSHFLMEVVKFGFTQDEEVARVLLNQHKEGNHEIEEEEDDEHGVLEVLFNSECSKKKDFYYYVIGILHDFCCRFIMKDGQSILYHIWNIDNSFKFNKFLDALPREKIEELTEESLFGGKSAAERIRSQIKFNSTTNAYLKYFAQNYEVEDLLRILYPYGEEQIISRCIERDFELICNFAETTDGRGVKMQKIVEAFVENLITLERNQISDLKPFHNIPERITKHCSILVPFFDRLNDENLLQKFFFEKDKQGNLPVHIFASERKTHLISIFENHLTSDEIFRAMKEKNQRKETFFHIYGKSFTQRSRFCSTLEAFLSIVDKTDLFRTLQEQDCDGRTAFHFNHGHCFLPYILEHAERTSFCQIEDIGKNNILHHFAASRYLRKPFAIVLSFFLKLLKVEDLKRALGKRNWRNQTPIDICRSDNEDELETELFGVFEIFEEYIDEDDVDMMV